MTRTRGRTGKTNPQAPARAAEIVREYGPFAGADHITPPCQSETINSKVGSADKEVFRIPGGHIGIMAGSGAARYTWPHIDAWLSPRSK